MVPNAPVGRINDEQWQRFSPEFCTGLGCNPNGQRRYPIEEVNEPAAQES